MHALPRGSRTTSRASRSGRGGRLPDVAHVPAATIDEDVVHELDRLRAVGISRAILVDLTRPECDVPVVRVVVPGLEGWADRAEGVLPGARAAGPARRAMTEVAVFLGPTLGWDEARKMLDAEYLPPAAHGDVLHAVRRGVRVIGIVDGFFERVPAVWHKEILFALAEGVHVFGAASMGALRAAELDDVRHARASARSTAPYADGALEDDDEVAVAHGGADDGYRPLSDAMVDIRATLEAAAIAGIVTAEAAAAMTARAKATFYPRRLLLGVLEPGGERLREWVAAGAVHLKRGDAVALLATIRDDLAAGLEPARPAWRLQHTRFWNSVVSTS